MRNIALICLDSVRKDTFDEYAKRLNERTSLSFDQCRAASSWSAPSYMSMLTGKLPNEHGIHCHNQSTDSVDRTEIFLDSLDDHRTLGVSTNVFASTAYGYDRFFDCFTDISDTHRFPAGLNPAEFTSEHGGGFGTYLTFLRSALSHDHPGMSLANGAIGLIDAYTERSRFPKIFDDGANAVIRESKRSIDVDDEPFFLFTTFMEAHTPLRHVRGFDRSLHTASNTFTTDERSVWELMGTSDIHREFLEIRRGLYNASVDFLDRTIAAFVDWLEVNTERETTVVITADHGENQGYSCEGGLVRHKSSLSEGLLHVPLCVINPPSESPERVTGYVSHLSLGRLLTAFAHGDYVDVTEKRIVAELIGMSAGPEPPARREYWDRLHRAAYEGTKKVTWDSAGEQIGFELERDRPCWQRVTDRNAQVPDWTTSFFEESPEVCKQRLRKYTGKRDTIDDKVKLRLEKFGYA